MTGPGFGDSTVKGAGDNHNMNAKLEFGTDDTMHLNDFAFFSLLNNQPIEV